MAARGTTTCQQPTKRLTTTELRRSRSRQPSHNAENALDPQKTSLPLEKKPSPRDIIASQVAPAIPTVGKRPRGLIRDTKSAIKSVEAQFDAQSSEPEETRPKKRVKFEVQERDDDSEYDFEPSSPAPPVYGEGAVLGLPPAPEEPHPDFAHDQKRVLEFTAAQLKIQVQETQIWIACTLIEKMSENVPANERTEKILEYEQIIEMLNDEALETVSLKPQLRAARDKMQRMESAFVEALGQERRACQKKIERQAETNQENMEKLRSMRQVINKLEIQLAEVDEKDAAINRKDAEIKRLDDKTRWQKGEMLKRDVYSTQLEELLRSKGIALPKPMLRYQDLREGRLAAELAEIPLKRKR